MICKTCKYRGFWGYNGALTHCDYIGITGHMRGCLPGDDCTKYERGAAKKPKRNDIVINPHKYARKMS